MGTIYGVANPLALPAAYTPTGDVVLTAGAETTFITTGALTAASPGFYYPVIWLTIAMLFGVAAPAALTFAFKLGAGADVDSFALAPAAQIVSETDEYSVCLVGANSGTAWVGSGSTINITGLGTTNNSTVKQVGTRAVVALYRGPDA